MAENEKKSTINAIDILVGDHARIRELCGLVEKTGDPDKRDDIFAELQEEMIKNMHVEQTVLYPDLLEFNATHNVSAHLNQEHELIGKMIDQLNALGVEDPGWPDKFATFKEVIEGHMQEEEETMFEHARELLDQLRLEGLGQEIIEEKEIFEAELDAEETELQ